jgi:hypothetical protein
MRFRIEGPGWPVGGVLIAAGTVFDFANPEQKELAQGLIPINAVCLDEEAWHQQVRLYPEHKHLLRGGWI